MKKEALRQRDHMVCLNCELSITMFYILIYLTDRYLGCTINKEKRNRDFPFEQS